MRWLVRLYPRWWRERYADELRAVLQQRGARPLDVPDVLRCALDARLHLKAGRAARVGRALVALATAVAAAILLALANVWGVWPFGQSAAPPATSLYLLDLSRGERLLPIEFDRLVGVPHGPGIRLQTSKVLGLPFEVVQSDDGRTLAAVWSRTPNGAPANGPAGWPCGDLGASKLCREYVRVVDARTGAVTAGFNLPPGVEVQGLSPDGTKIVGARLQQARTRRGWRAWLRWYAVSSAGGRIANRVDLPLEVYAPTLYDPTHDRLYALQPFQTNEAFTPIQGPFGEGAMTWETVSDFEGMRPLKPGPSRLLAYDLRTSHQVARLVLSGVTYGSWPGQSWTPGLALSPDGRQVALYDGRTNRLTLIDAMRMRIVKTETISRPQSLVARLAQWLGLTPTEAWAKGEAVSGVDLQMRYSPDGRYLYVTGTESSPGPRNPSIGIRAIDMARGVISGEALKGQTLAWIQPEPDGGALYTLVIIGDGTAPVPMIRRLAPETLRVMAQGLASLDSPNPRYYVLAAPAR